MITREEIAQFYERYKRNLDEENRWFETVRNIENETAWFENAQKRNQRFKELYKDNMEMINKYFNPYIKDEMELTDEVADELLKQSTQYLMEGFVDSICGVALTRKVSDYYKQKGNFAKYIEATHIAAVFCIERSTYDSLMHGFTSSKEELEYIDKYFRYDDAGLRSKMISACYNCAVCMTNVINLVDPDNQQEIIKVQEELIKYAKMAEHYLCDEKIRELEKDNINFDERLDMLYFNICANAICNIGLNYPLNQELLEYTTQRVVDRYKKLIKKNNESDLSDDVVCGYLTCSYRSGKITYSEFVYRYYTYCKLVLENEKKYCQELEDDSISESRYFMVCTYKLPMLIQYLDENNISKVLYDEINKYCVDSFLDLLDWLPHSRNSSKMCTIVARGGLAILKYLSSTLSPYSLIVKLIINRDESAIIHSTMVRKLSNIVLKHIFRNKPEILIGLFGTKNVVDVLSRQEDITEYLCLSALIYDLGRIQYVDIFNKSTRDITRIEKLMINKHVEDGYSIIKGIESLEIYKDIILGHHKSYDGKSGYPEFFDNTKSDVRVLIDIIKICDYLDDVSSDIGASLSFDEAISTLKRGQGTEYNPDIVRLITSKEKFRNELYECCYVNKDRVYYETYYEFFNKHNNHESEEQPGFIGFANSANNTMHNMIIDFYEDSIFSTYFGSNSVFNSRIGGGFKDFINNKLMPITHSEDQKRLKLLLNYGALCDKFSSGNGSFELEVRVMAREEWRWHRFHFVMVEERNGGPLKVIVAMDDVNEECVRRLQILNALEEAKEEAKQANSAKSMFISNISHEIRTPMNAIVGMVEIMLREDLPSSQKNYLMNIRNSGNALLSIINDILDFSKMESGKLEIIEDEYEMMSLINDLSMIFLNRIGEKPVELIFDIDKNLPEKLYGDIVRIRQIIINIMNNAIKFTDQGYVKLKMVIKPLQDDIVEIEFSIKDTGIGIKEEELPKLFGAFQQVDIKRNRQTEGTGLGLVISKQLIELMGGSISVDSEYGKGTEFVFTIRQKVISNKIAVNINLTQEEKNELIVGGYFKNEYVDECVNALCQMYHINYVKMTENKVDKVDIIFTDGGNHHVIKKLYADNNVRICVIQNPMMESIKDNDARIVNKPIYSVNFCHIINNEEDKATSLQTDQYLDFCAPDAKILIVDDTEMNLTVAKGLLQPLRMQIDTAENGKTAIDMVQQKEYHLIFMDHKMPVMDGVEATECIRNLDGEYYKSVPIIALTANAVLDARESFMKAGMNDFVAKPIEMKNICSKIKKWLPKELILKRKDVAEAKDPLDIIPIPAIRGIDVKEGIKNSGSVEMYGTLLNDFYKLIDLKINTISNLLDKEDIYNYTIQVHAMKSVTRMIGAISLSEKFKKLEEWGNANEKELIYEETPKIIEELSAYKNYLKDFVDNWEMQTNKSDKLKVTNEELIELLEAMITAITDCDLDMMDKCMDQLERYDIPEIISNQMEKLNIYVADYSMEDIVVVANEMIEILKR